MKIVRAPALFIADQIQSEEDDKKGGLGLLFVQDYKEGERGREDDVDGLSGDRAVVVGEHTVNFEGDIARALTEVPVGLQADVETKGGGIVHRDWRH